MKTSVRIAVLAMLASTGGCAHRQAPAEAAQETPVSADRIGTSLKQYASLLEQLGHSKTQRPTEAGRLDAEFYRRALAVGIADLALSQHAARHAASAEVRALADTLAKHHAATNRQLSAASGIPQPEIAGDDKHALATLTSKHGAAYDLGYLHAMDERHLAALELFEAAWTSAVHQNTRVLAETILPTLRAHEAMIDTLLASREQPL